MTKVQREPISTRFRELPNTSIGGSYSLLKAPIESGIPELDRILGPGIPRGHIVEIFGPTACGKTALALHLANKIQGPVLYIDADYTLDTPPCIISNPSIYRLRVDTFEAALNACRMAADGFEAIIWDSLPSLPLESYSHSTYDSCLKDPDGTHIYERKLENALKVLIPALRKSGCILVLITQVRSDLRVVYGPEERPLDGWALRSFASIRLEMHRIDQIFDPDDKKNFDQAPRSCLNAKAQVLRTKQKGHCKAHIWPGFPDRPAA